MVYLNRQAAAQFRTSNTVAQIRGDFQDQLDQIIPPEPAQPAYDPFADSTTSTADQAAYQPLAPTPSPDMAGSQPAVASQPEPAAPPPAASAPPASSFTPPGMTPVSYDGGQPAPPPAPMQSQDWQKLAYDQLNKPYIWGSGSGAGGRGTGDINPATGIPNGFDCSGYVAWVMKNGLGIDLPAFTGSAYTKTTAVSLKDARPGDVVFYNMDQGDPHIQHMAIFLGDGKIIEAGGTGRNVNIASLYANGTPEIRRPSGEGAAAVPRAATYAAQTAEAQLPQESWQARFSGMLDGALKDVGQSANAVGQAKDQAVKSAADWSADFGKMLDSTLGGYVEQQTAPTNREPLPALDSTPGQVQQDFTPQWQRDMAAQWGGQSNESLYVGQQANPAPADAGQVGARAYALEGNFTRDLADIAIPRPIANATLPKETPLIGDLGGYTLGNAVGDTIRPTNIVMGAALDVAGQVGMAGLRTAAGSEPIMAAGQALRSGAGQIADTAGDLLGRVPARQPAQANVNFAAGGAGNINTRGIVDGLIEKFDDRNVGLRRYEEETAKLVGRELRTGEQASVLSRLAADPAAKVMVDEGLKPAIQSVQSTLGDQGFDDLSELVAARNNVDVAKVLGNPNRTFSGGIDAAQSAQRVAQLEQDPVLKQAADMVSDHVNTLRDRLVQSGVWSKQFAADMKQQYPHWVPTRILDYMSDDAGQRIGGKGLSLRDNGLRSYTLAGTDKMRQNPVEALVDYTFQVERMARKNVAAAGFKAADDLRPTSERVLRKVTSAYKPTADEATFEFFENGVKQRFVAPKAIAEAINGASVMPVPEWMGKYGDFVRAAVTQRNPVFLAGNAALDIPEYLLTSYTAEGANPAKAPRILWELAKGYKSAFDGLLTGEYKGAAAEFMKAGGGQSGVYQVGNKAAKQTVEGLRRANVVQVKSKADLARLTKNILTLKPVEGLGERIEQGPRIAAYNLAKQRGEGSIKSAIRGREVTIDFSRGGTVTKYINSFVPFFNVGFQGPSKVIRTVKNNPVAASLTIGQLVGFPTVLAEAWNNADPQRAEDYKNVSDYYKRTGVVIMLDGTTDANGDRIPQFVHINMRNWAGFVQIARQAVNVAGIGSPEEWGKLLRDTTSSFLPTGGSNAADLANSLTTPIPVLGTASQLTSNKDVFRGTDIATKANDARAGGTARAITDVVNSVMAPFTANRVRPSQVDFAIKDALPGAGATALSVGDFAFGPPKDKRQTVSDVPLVGGLAGRFIKSGGNQQLYDAKDNVITPQARQVLEAAGVDYTPSAMADTAYKADLTNTEQTKAQQLANQYVNAAILSLPDNARFQALAPDQRREAVMAVVDAAKQQARDEVVQGMTRELPRPQGQPPKYLGVSSYAREIQIDQAISAYNAWQRDRRTNPVPTAQEMADARLYGRQINPLYTRWAQQNRAEGQYVRSVGAPAPSGATTRVLAPAPAR